MWGGRSDDPFAEMDQVFRRFASLGFGGGGMHFGSSSRGSWLPAMDLSESAKQYTLTVDVPGIRKEDLEVNVTENKVCVKGDRKMLEAAAAGEEAGGFHLRERGYGAFERCVSLPRRILERSVTASHNNGTLEVVMQKETPTDAAGGSNIAIR